MLDNLLFILIKSSFFKRYKFKNSILNQLKKLSKKDINLFLRKDLSLLTKKELYILRNKINNEKYILGKKQLFYLMLEFFLLSYKNIDKQLLIDNLKVFTQKYDKF